MATKPEQHTSAFRPMETWDKRDEVVLLLVDYSDDGEHPLDDALVAITVGHNNDHNVGDGEGQGWQFAGWCWTHDHYVEGKGKPIGWMPLTAMAEVLQALRKIAHLRPAGDVETCKNPRKIVEEMERIALSALAQVSPC